MATVVGASGARDGGGGGGEGELIKPFTPEKAKEIIMSLQQPAVFCNMVFDWPAQHWNVTYLSKLLCGKQIRFRMGMKKTDTVPQFETMCSYVDATLEEFLAWSCDRGVNHAGPFTHYDNSKFWAYADYKYLASVFEDNTDVLQNVVWSDFGFPGRNGRESTLWIGSLGANTPCHLDCYGCNLVFQVQGRKRWHLFPPQDTAFLYPTRIPYEESSVFSKVNVVNPDLKHFPQFLKAQRHMVTLYPGQVLFVPRHWWHYVESIDPITVSINSWIELEEDHQARVEEAITRMIVCALKGAEDPTDTKAWLNPTEVEGTSHEINCQYLNGAISAYLEHSKVAETLTPTEFKINGKHRVKSPLKKRKLDVCTRSKEKKSPNCTLATVTAKPEEKIPFGLDLIPVSPSLQDESSERGIDESDIKDVVKESGGREGNLNCAREQLVMNQAEMPLADNVVSDSTTCPSQPFISTDDLLDCLVDPKVIHLVAQLLLQKRT
ncbi:HSPB1-associated protein 1 isoform X2 [Trichosurus vulpecula]|uniref:HSPB1-associated protein 1 isoform X2 n=1 Tax=Trichosurus vulpecula TaxID=9337 RepID=UPI00186AF8E8|nr:HSPB1-associated protein 1 isoform X2 [Trichosurus vulpecula]